MKWLRTRRPAQPTEATQAREKAERDLDATIAQTPAYEALGKRLRVTVREQNHLTELWTELLGRS